MKFFTFPDQIHQKEMNWGRAQAHCPGSISSIQVLNPSHRLNVCDLPEVPLSGGKMCMPHDHLADDLNRSAGSGGEGGGVPS
jgi:hypothetical protein